MLQRMRIAPASSHSRAHAAGAGEARQATGVTHELRLGTRGSQLALWQANAVASAIALAGGPACRIVVIKTSGDRLQDASLRDIGGKRLFVKEIEDALLERVVDLAVHSAKDMPADLPDGLTIAGVLPREDPFDAIVLPAGRGEAVGRMEDLLGILGQTPMFGTSSVRRIAQLTRLAPHARFSPIRGNLDTRLRKLDAGEHDALVLASAGLRRLGFGARITLTLPLIACVPAPGQGIVAIETRHDDEAARRAVEAIHDAEAGMALSVERALVARLGGGCQMPMGALATITATDMTLTAAVAAIDGTRVVRASSHGTLTEAAAVGDRVIAELRTGGADAILAEARRMQSNVAGIQP
jgi:hydroxymethylbilane synthase